MKLCLAGILEWHTYFFLRLFRLADRSSSLLPSLSDEDLHFFFLFLLPSLRASAYKRLT